MGQMEINKIKCACVVKKWLYVGKRFTKYAKEIGYEYEILLLFGYSRSQLGVARGYGKKHAILSSEIRPQNVVERRSRCH